KPYLPLQKSYAVYQEFDPYHPTWINAAPRNEIEDLRPYGAACDIWGCDIYPVPSPSGHSGLEDKMMTSVGKYCTRMDETTWGRKPIWMALQGFGWGENPECGPTGRSKTHPTLPQLRFIMFDAMLNGCTGFGLWGSQFVKDITFAENLLVNCADVHQYSTLFINGRQLPNAPSSDSAIRAQVIEYNGEKTYFIMGVENRKAKGTVTIDGKPLTELTSFGSKVTQDGQTLSVEMEPYGYAVFATAPLPPPFFELIPTNPQLEAQGSPIPPIIDKIIREIESFKSFDTKAFWIWSPKNYDQAASVCFIAKAFNATPKDKALLRLAVDDNSTVFLNGKEIATTQAWDKLFDIDLAPHLKDGENLLVIRAEDAGALPCGLLAELHVNGSVFLSDASWLSKPAKTNKDLPPTSLQDFENAKLIQPYGGGAWRKNVQEIKK
ncbi:MAG: hypothetical protein J6X55_15450, partial [Victivallales bacterium]|nr:hypothetical protein [Victivallales bacterium]